MKNRILGFLILAFVGLLATMEVTAQRVRTTAVFDGDTATRPKAGFYGVGVKSGRVFLVKPTGNTERLLSASTHVGVNGQFLFSNGTVNLWSSIGIANVSSLQSSLDAKFNTPSGLTTNYLSKWTGSAFGNSAVFESVGNVGIGTATPDRKLVINGEIGFGYTDGNSYSGLRQNIAGGHFGLQFFSAITASPTNRSYEFLNNSGNSLVTILNGGFIGIGTASPSHKLTVAASSLYTSINSGDGLVVSSPSITSAEMILGVNGASGNIIQSRAGSSGWPLLLNPYDGNVGINTAAPTSKLQVVGLPTYADNSAATSGGLTVGAFYRTSTGVLMVVY